jgi:hypothetical protein
MSGALRELGVALVQGNDVVHRKLLHVYPATGVTAARAGAFEPNADVQKRFPFVHGMLAVSCVFLFVLLCVVCVLHVVLCVTTLSL